MNTLLTDGEATDYAGQLAILKDDDLVDEICRRIAAAGFSRRQCADDQRCTIGYDETVIRGLPHLYQRAWNRAARGEGVAVDETDLRLARDPRTTLAA